MFEIGVGWALCRAKRGGLRSPKKSRVRSARCECERLIKMALKILRVDWIDLAQVLVRWPVCVKTVLDILVLQNGNFLKLNLPHIATKPCHARISYDFLQNWSPLGCRKVGVTSSDPSDPVL